MIDADSTTDALVRDWVRMCSVLGGHSMVEAGTGVSLCATGIRAANLNCVFTTRPEASPSEVVRLLETVQRTGLPHCVQLRPRCTAELTVVLRERGMAVVGSIPLMRLDASDANLGSVAAHPDLNIRLLTSNERHLHISLASAGFEAPMALFDELMSEAVFALPGFRSYVGISKDGPVTTAVAIVEADHVGIYNVATPTGSRGRGYGAAITARGVQDGFAAGASFALLQSSEQGFGVYQRLGFRTLENWELWVSP